MNKVNRTTMKLPELALMLEHARYGEMTHDERERLYKAFSRLDALLPISGASEVITTLNVGRYVKFEIILWSGGEMTSYSFTQSGLEIALSDAASGDKVIVPPGLTLTSGITVPAGVTLSGYGKAIPTLTADDAIEKLITGNSGSIIENMEINYTSQMGAAESSWVIESTNTIVRNVNIICTEDGGAADTFGIEGDLYDSDNEAGLENVYVRLVGTSTIGGSSGLYGISTSFDNNATINNVVVDIENVGTTFSLGCNFNGSSGDRLYLSNVWVNVTSTYSSASPTGIKCDYTDMANCHVRMDIGDGDTYMYGIWLNDECNAYLSTVKITANSSDGDEFLEAFRASDNVNMYWCEGYVNDSGSPLASNGLLVTTNDTAVAKFCTWTGDTHDIWVATGATLSVYSCHYTSVDEDGTLTPLAGDRGGVGANNTWTGTNTFNGLTTFGASINLPYAAKTATYTITSSDYLIDCTANTFTVTLPTAASIAGRVYSVKNSGAGTITLDGDGAETIDGSTTKTLAQYDNVLVMSNGTNWIIL